MRVLEGKSVFSGIAIGKISILQKADTSVKRTRVGDPEAEIARVQEAKEKAVAQLQKLYDKALQEVGESGAAIFEVHQMMLDDEDYLDSIDNIPAGRVWAFTAAAKGKNANRGYDFPAV